jgi:hypothetical protein
MSNSQFKQLGKRVERLEDLLNAPHSPQQKHKQQQMEQAVNDWEKVRQNSARVLLDSESTPEQLEAILPSLTKPGHRAYAELEIERKRGQQALNNFPPFDPNHYLVRNMKAAAADGRFYQWQEQLRLPSPPAAQNKRPSKAAPKRNSNVTPSMQRAADQLWEMSHPNKQVDMNQHRGPLSPNKNDESHLMLPNPWNGVVL